MIAEISTTNASSAGAMPASTAGNDGGRKISEKGQDGKEIAVMLPGSSELRQEQRHNPLSVSEEAVVKAVERANKALMGPPKRYEYSVHKGSGDIVVKVINKDTNETIAEIPPAKILDVVTNLIKINGAIIDEKR